MRRLIILLAAVGCVSAAAVLSLARPEKAPDPAAAEAKFAIRAEAKNPWTSLAPNVSPEQFQFAVVSDRTGGHRKGIFSRAVQQINLLQPEFVMSVGDLIEGSAEADINRKQWGEFDAYAKQFAMPFFYCPGNHDANNKAKADVWGERLGRPYYHFTYKNCLFLVLNSNDPDPAVGDGKSAFGGTRIGKAQRAYIEKALKETEGARWTFVFLHHPIWAGRDLTETGWLEVEKLLAGRKYTTFCGHLHQYRKYLRNGANYYQLATTGGGSALRGIEYGEFDQVGWVTVKADGPVIANVLLNGVLNDTLTPFASTEDGGESRTGLPAVTGTVALKGQPAAGLAVVFTEIVTGTAKPTTGNARVMPDGSFTIYAPRGAAGLKAARYAVTFDLAQPIVIEGRPKDNPVPAKYRALSTTPLRVEVTKDGPNRFEFKIEE